MAASTRKCIPLNMRVKNHHYQSTTGSGRKSGGYTMSEVFELMEVHGLTSARCVSVSGKVSYVGNAGGSTKINR